MFLRSEESVFQSAGIVRRDQLIADTVTIIAEMNDLLKKQGIRFVVASPPNSASIYPDELPRWLRNQGRFTEYDLLLGALRAHGINVVDLRASLRQARTTGNLYFLHDTHWTPRGSIIGFNSVAEAAGHPDWKLDVDASLLKPIPLRGGDLARMLGVEEDVTEAIENLSFAANPELEFTSDHPAPPEQPAFSVAGRRSGETLLVLGDSFTQTFFPPLLVDHVGRLVWMSHVECGLDWALVDKIHPDEIWWMPTEREFLCFRGRPDHFPSYFALKGQLPPQTLLTTEFPANAR